MQNYAPDEFIEEFDPEQENFVETNDQFDSGQEEDESDDMNITDLQESDDQELAAFDESVVDDDVEPEEITEDDVDVTQIDEMEGDLTNDDFENDGDDYFN
jgi:hypothetical protein